jgi:hypothetical protein
MLEVARVVQQGEKAKENPLIMTKGRVHSDTSLVSPQHQSWPNCTSLNVMGMTTQRVGFVGWSSFSVFKTSLKRSKFMWQRIIWREKLNSGINCFERPMKT